MESLRKDESSGTHLLNGTGPEGELSGVIATATLLARIEINDRKAIISCARTYRFARDAVLFTQGQPVHSLALIRSGSVKLTQTSHAGNDVLMWASGRGDVLGLLAGSSSSLHTCTATVLKTGSAWLWSQDQVRALIDRYPQLMSNLDQILSDRLRELEERFREVATETASRRIALTLERLSSHVGRMTTDGIEVAFSREELAQMAGTTFFTVSRVISRWAEVGLVMPRRGAVVVRDRKGLQLLALRGG